MPPYNKTGTGAARLAPASRNNKAAINRQNCRKRALHPFHTNGPRRSQSEASPKQFVRTSKKGPTLPKAGNQQAAPKQSVGITKECPTAPRTGNKPRARLCLTQNHEISRSHFVHFLMIFCEEVQPWMSMHTKMYTPSCQFRQSIQVCRASPCMIRLPEMS